MPVYLIILARPETAACNDVKWKNAVGYYWHNKQQKLAPKTLMKQYQILIIDDDIELIELLKEFLEKNNYDVSGHHTGEGAIELILQKKPDLLILDVMLPSIDGISICREVRKQYSGSILMLTALDEDSDEVTGLEVGADDYLCKPVKPRVLLAHIRAQMRRREEWEKRMQTETLYACGSALVLDGGKHRVSLKGEFVELSSSEYELLWLLALNQGSVVSRESLYKKIYRLEHDGIDRSIDLRISRIRKKLGDNPKSPSSIKTVRNKGYLLAN